MRTLDDAALRAATSATVVMDAAEPCRDSSGDSTSPTVIADTRGELPRKRVTTQPGFASSATLDRKRCLQLDVEGWTVWRANAGGGLCPVYRGTEEEARRLFRRQCKLVPGWVELRNAAGQPIATRMRR